MSYMRGKSKTTKYLPAEKIGLSTARIRSGLGIASSAGYYDTALEKRPDLSSQLLDFLNGKPNPDNDTLADLLELYGQRANCQLHSKKTGCQRKISCNLSLWNGYHTFAEFGILAAGITASDLEADLGWNKTKPPYRLYDWKDTRLNKNSYGKISGNGVEAKYFYDMILHLPAISFLSGSNLYMKMFSLEPAQYVANTAFLATAALRSQQLMLSNPDELAGIADTGLDVAAYANTVASEAQKCKISGDDFDLIFALLGSGIKVREMELYCDTKKLGTPPDNIHIPAKEVYDFKLTACHVRLECEGTVREVQASIKYGQLLALWAEKIRLVLPEVKAGPAITAGEQIAGYS